MLDIIALGNNMHVTFFTIEKLGGGSETHVFIDVYGMFIRICLSSPFFVPLWRPKRGSRTLIFWRSTCYNQCIFLLNKLFTLRAACCRSYLHMSRTCFTSVCVSYSFSFSLWFFSPWKPQYRVDVYCVALYWQPIACQSSHRISSVPSSHADVLSL